VADQVHHFVQFLIRIRRTNPVTRNALMVIAVEGDYTPILGTDIERACAGVRDHLGRYDFIRGVKNDPRKPVVMKGNRTPGYVGVAQVAGRTDRLRVAPVVEQSGRDAGDTDTLQERLVAQMRQYRLTVRKPGKDRVRTTQDPRYSGKESGRDDLVVAWLMAVYWLVMYYIEFRRTIIPGMTLVQGVKDAHGPSIDAIEKDVAYAATLSIPTVSSIIGRMQDRLAPADSAE
jgi:hypothetical protein